MTHLRHLIAAASLVLAACATPEEPETRNYRCESGQTLAVTFDDDKALFSVDGEAFALPAVTLDDYQLGTTRMVVRPSGMTLQFGDQVTYWGCQPG